MKRLFTRNWILPPREPGERDTTDLHAGAFLIPTIRFIRVLFRLSKIGVLFAAKNRLERVALSH
jgi:hypothetical protein